MNNERLIDSSLVIIMHFRANPLLHVTSSENNCVLVNKPAACRPHWAYRLNQQTADSHSSTKKHRTAPKLNHTIFSCIQGSCKRLQTLNRYATFLLFPHLKLIFGSWWDTCHCSATIRYIFRLCQTAQWSRSLCLRLSGRLNRKSRWSQCGSIQNTFMFSSC